MMPRVPLVAIILVGLLTELALAKDDHEKLKDVEKHLGMIRKIGIKRKCSTLGLEANKWARNTDEELGEILEATATSDWNYDTNITDENACKVEEVASETNQWLIPVMEKAEYYLKHPKKMCNATTFRMLRWLRQMALVPPAKDEATRLRITRLVTKMQMAYATSNVTRNETVYKLNDLSKILAKSRDSNELLWAWGAWHNTTGRQMKKPYEELVKKMNEAAKDNGYSDIGLYWKYADYDKDNIETEMDELFKQVLPLYEQLHAYVRRKLSKHYESVNNRGFIPAHLLGDMWAQQWDSIDDLLLPYPSAPSNYNITRALISQGYTPERMFRLAEQFFVSLGLEPMTQDFWKKSMFVRPKDNRSVECHASAFDFASQSDFRIKMCTEVTSADLEVIHHEMGHVEYYMQYRHQPFVFRTGANAAFHEAIGDTIALSVRTDTHLTAIGLIPPNYHRLTHKQKHEQKINSLMRTALLKIAFLPFGYALDKWRFKVFRGEITPADYTTSWWKMRENYGGITAPVPRSSEDFDLGAKYHIPSNVPYSRYFFSFVGQFQFHAALCREAGHKGPLHTCDIYQSIKAGKKLRSLLSLGSSRPWEEVLHTFTGQRSFKADSMLAYFKPLYDWLKKENDGHPVGWKRDGQRP